MFSKKVILIAGSSAALLVGAGLGVLSSTGNESARNFCSNNSTLAWSNFDEFRVLPKYKDANAEMLSSEFEKRVSGNLATLKASLGLLSGVFVPSSTDLKVNSETDLKNSEAYLDALKEYEQKISSSSEGVAWIAKQEAIQKLFSDASVYEAAYYSLNDIQWKNKSDAKIRDAFELDQVAKRDLVEWRAALPETAELRLLEKASIGSISKLREICRPIVSGN